MKSSQLNFLLIVVLFVLGSCEKQPPPRNKGPFAPIDVNGKEYRPTADDAGQYFYLRGGDEERVLLGKLSDFSLELSKGFSIIETDLGSDIRGIVVSNVEKIADGGFRWTAPSGGKIETDPETGVGLADLDYYRQGAVYGTLREHWGAKDGWDDHVTSLYFGDTERLVAAKLPTIRSGEELAVGICHLAPNTEEGRIKGRETLRSAAAYCLDCAYQLGVSSFRVDLYLEVYEPFGIDFPGQGDAYYNRSFPPSRYLRKKGDLNNR